MSGQPPPQPEEHVLRIRTDTTLLTGAVHHVVTCSCGWEDAGPCARTCAADHLTVAARGTVAGTLTLTEAAVAAVEVRRLSRERYVHPDGVREDVDAVLEVLGIIALDLPAAIRRAIGDHVHVASESAAAADAVLAELADRGITP